MQLLALQVEMAPRPPSPLGNVACSGTIPRASGTYHDALVLIAACGDHTMVTNMTASTGLTPYIE